MKDIEQLLRKKIPSPQRQLNENFTESIIAHIKAEPNPPKMSRIRQLYLNYTKLPRLAAVALAIVPLTGLGASSYAAYQWLAPRVEILQINRSNADNKREYTVNIENCGVVVGGQPIQDGKKVFEVAKNTTLTDKQVTKVIRDTCVHQAAIEFSYAKWPYGGEKTASAALMELQAQFLVGKITAIDTTSVTLEMKRYVETPSYTEQTSVITEPKLYPEGKISSLVIPLDPSVTIWQNKTQLTLKDLIVGDYIFIGSLLDIAEERPAPAINGIIKLDLDPDYVQFYGMGNPTIVGSIFQLIGCDHSPEYTCRAVNNSYAREKIVYAVSTYTDIASNRATEWEENNKYLRNDIQGNEESMYHTVEGRIASIEGNTLTIIPHGKEKTVSVELPYDALASFKKAEGTTIEINDLLRVNFFQKENEDHTKVNSSDLLILSLAMFQNADGTFQKF